MGTAAFLIFLLLGGTACAAVPGSSPLAIRTRSVKLPWAGFLIGAAYWILESFLHTYLFNSGPLASTLLCEHDPNEMWMRILIVVVLTAFGWAAERLVRSERHYKEQAQKLNRLFHYVLQICQGVEAGAAETALAALKTDLELEEKALHDEGDVGKIVQVIRELSEYVDSRIGSLQAILGLTHEINKGLLVEEVLERAYEAFRPVIPYDRIGVALLEDGGRTLVCRWARADYGTMKMPLRYSAPMAGSSLQEIIDSGTPRIINDLSAYFSEHPESQSSKLILEEGILASLTCPLVAMGKPMGFIFFSSRTAGAYRSLHADIFKLVAGQLSVVIEKGHIHEQLMMERDTSEALLLNVMPARIISRIKAGIQSPVEEIAEAGVLFADIVGFTDLARRFPAESVVRFLREVFTHWDALCEEHGLEKIKTIGDAYMVSTGGASTKKRGLLDLAEFAQSMLATAPTLHYPDGRPLQVRIGIHAGPVIAGVIGQKKFAYDIWGDTVNIAKRLEAAGAPGKILVSSRVQALLTEEQFTFESRGEVELKGAGRIAAYFMRDED